MDNLRLRIAICGGGIGGLTCAIALSKYPDLKVDVYEAASRFAEVGTGFAVWPRPWKVLESLGLGPDLLQATDLKPTDGPVPIFQWRKGDQNKASDFTLFLQMASFIGFHRPDFQNVLIRHLPPTCSIHCSKRLKSYQSLSPSPGVDLLFEDGTTATYDLLIGADGIKSAVRGTMMAQAAAAAASPQDASDCIAATEPVWCGTVVYRSVVPAERLRAVAPDHRVFNLSTHYFGKKSYIISYPLAQGKLINIAACICRPELEGTQYDGPWVSTVSREEWTDVWAGWEPEVHELISCVDKALKWAIHTVLPLRTYVTDRVALIGDAAHADQGAQGAGAGLAVEDAYLLSRLLASPDITVYTLARALRVYDAVRPPFTQDSAEKTRLNVRCFTFMHPIVKDIGEKDGFSKEEVKGMLARMAEVVVNNWKWVWSTTLDQSVEDALKILDEA